MSDSRNRASTEVNILYQSSGLYAPIMGVSLTSLLENNCHIQIMNIYVIDGGIGTEDKSKITRLCEIYNRNVIFISGKSIDELLEKKGIPKWRNSYAMYYKIYAIDLIGKQVDRLLVLDADTIINKRIDSLYFIDLDGRALGMVQDFMPHIYMKTIGMEKKQAYYNSGVVLIDINRWKEQHCRAKIDEFLQGDTKRVLYADQDAISIALQTHINKLPITYNFFIVFSALTECLSFDLEDIYSLYDIRKLHHFYSQHEMNKAVKDSTIYHYEGGAICGRSWEEGEHYSIFNIWDYYNALSPWRDMEKWEKTIVGYHKIEMNLQRLLPKRLFKIVYKIAYNMYWQSIIRIRPNS